MLCDDIGMHGLEKAIVWWLLTKSLLMYLLSIPLIILWTANTMMVVMSLSRVRYNLTTNECMNSDKYSYVSLNGKYYNRNDRGTWENMYRFFTCDDSPVPSKTPYEEREEKRQQDRLLLVLQQSENID